MTTQIHDSATCTAGFNGQPCVMCHFVREFEKSSTRMPSESLKMENQPAGFLALEPESGLERDSEQSSPIPAPSDFDHEWREAPESHRRYTCREDAFYWFMRGVRAGELNQIVEENRVFREMAERRGLL